jgi:phasin family protein
MGFLLRRKNRLDVNCAMHYICVVGLRARLNAAIPELTPMADPRPRSKVMSSNFDEFQKFGKEQLETASSVAASLAKGFQTIAAETTDYSKKSIESNSAYVEKLLGAKSLDNAIQIQSEYAKSAYEGFVAQATKLGELYTILAKEAFKPVESVFAKVQAAATSAK